MTVMAKKEDLTKSFGSSRKKKLSLTEIDKIAEEREEEKQGRAEPTKKEVTKAVKPMKEVKTSFDISEDLHEEMRIHLIRKRVSMKDYLIGLIKKDLKIK